MGFSSRHAIATHVLLVLGCCGENRVCSEDLAKSVNTNSVVIRRLLSRLKEQELVEVNKGKDGGYSLSRSLHDISLWDIFEAVEDPPLFTQPASLPNQDCIVGCAIGPLLDNAYQATESALKDSLSRVKLSSLAKKCK